VSSGPAGELILKLQTLKNTGDSLFIPLWMFTWEEQLTESRYEQQYEIQ